MRCCLTTASEDETIAVGKRLGSLLKGGHVILLDGDLGAGKTRFAKGVARGLDVEHELTSPTFNLVLEYPLKALSSSEAASSPLTLRHFDLYRLEEEEQLDDIDYFGLIEDERAISLVEWGSKFSRALPVDYLGVSLLQNKEVPHQRAIELYAYGKHSQELLGQFAQQEGLAVHE